MVPAIATVVAGVNTRTGLMAAPATPPEVMEAKLVIFPAEAVSVDAVKITATRIMMLLKFILKSNTQKTTALLPFSRCNIALWVVKPSVARAQIAFGYQQQ
jgi:hypothetical protein